MIASAPDLCAECQGEFDVPFTVLIARVSETGCVTCAEYAQSKVAGSLAIAEEVIESAATVERSSLAEWKANQEAAHDAERQARALKEPVNAGAYTSDAVPIGIGESGTDEKKPKDSYLGASVESLMDPGIKPAGGSSKGRSRTKQSPIVCGQPCDCGCGMACEIKGAHDGTHACRESRRVGGRPTIEEQPRAKKVFARVSETTESALARTGKTPSTMLAELGAAILEGRSYNPLDVRGTGMV